MNFKNLRFYTVDLTDIINTLEDDERCSQYKANLRSCD